MTVKQLSIALSQIKPSLQDKEVKVLAPNGEMFSGDIKFVTKEEFNIDLNEENVDYIWLHY